jgi:hypothetical protein
MIPWSALGIAPPPAGAELRTDIAVTSWHRERWMSLSGRPPAAAMSHPETWPAIRLGNGPQMIETSPAHAVQAPG